MLSILGVPVKLQLAFILAVTLLAPACTDTVCSAAPEFVELDPCPPGATTKCPSNQYCQTDAGPPACVNRHASGPCLRGVECLADACPSGQCPALSCP